MVWVAKHSGSDSRPRNKGTLVGEVAPQPDSSHHLAHKAHPALVRSPDLFVFGENVEAVDLSHQLARSHVYFSNILRSPRIGMETRRNVHDF
jgi:hypothetical protein